MSEISQDTFFAPCGPHKPKRSATADRKEAPSANRANRRTISVPFSVSCAVFEFIKAHSFVPIAQQTVNSRENCRFRGIFVEQFNWIDLVLIQLEHQFRLKAPQFAAAAMFTVEGSDENN